MFVLRVGQKPRGCTKFPAWRLNFGTASLCSSYSFERACTKLQALLRTLVSELFGRSHRVARQVSSWSDTTPGVRSHSLPCRLLSVIITAATVAGGISKFHLKFIIAVPFVGIHGDRSRIPLAGAGSRVTITSRGPRWCRWCLCAGTRGWRGRWASTARGRCC